MDLLGAAHGWGLFGAAQNLSHISYNDETCHSYSLPTESPKNIHITWHIPWVLLTSAFFHRKSPNFTISSNTDTDYILTHNFWFFSLFLSL